jgi:ribonuclease III
MSRKLNERAAFEKRLGYRFKDVELLERALTHVSALPSEQARWNSYQRLEFLGDRVLGLVVATMLKKTFANADEGELSRRLAELVRAETCAEVAVSLDVGPAIRLGTGEAHSGGRRKKAILADICEALIGAVYLDAGFETASELVQRLWQQRMMAPRRNLRDGKTALQEWAQARALPIPNYTEGSRTGPAHSPVFEINVEVQGYLPAQAQGTSKRLAEQAAAEQFLIREGIWAEQKSE